MSGHSDWNELRDRRLAEPGAEAAYAAARREVEPARATQESERRIDE
ncbi:hypothetical protein [Dactylosporangium sp. CS-033363]